MTRMNLLDIVIGIWLLASFARGFSKGIWRSAMGLIGLIASFFGAYSLTPAFTSWLEKKYGLITTLASKIESLLPLPSGAASGNVDIWNRFSQQIPSSGPVAEIIRESLPAADPLLAQGANLVKAAAYTFSYYLIYCGAYFVLLCVIRALWNILTHVAIFDHELSVSSRFLGGFLEMSCSAFVISLALGALYPLISSIAGDGWKLAADSSKFLPTLLKIYSLYLPVLVARVPAAAHLLTR